MRLIFINHHFLTHVFIIQLCLIILTSICLCEHKVPNLIFKESIDGVVDAGNYSYFTYDGTEKVVLILHSLKGDADLYVSHAHESSNGNSKSSSLASPQPSYEMDSHDLQSVTCGEDRVEVPSQLKRPIGIAVYGHPSHDRTHFSLELLAYDDDDESDSYTNYEQMTQEDIKFYEEFFGEKYPRRRKKVTKKNREKENGFESEDNERGNTNIFASILLNILSSILDIFLEVVI